MELERQKSEYTRNIVNSVGMPKKRYMAPLDVLSARQSGGYKPPVNIDSVSIDVTDPRLFTISFGSARGAARTVVVYIQEHYVGNSFRIGGELISWIRLAAVP